MNLMTAANDTLLRLYCAARFAGVSTKDAIKNRELGQANVEYLGLLLILGAGLVLGGAALGGLGDAITGGSDGFLVQTVEDAIKKGLKAALSKLGIDL